MKETKIVTIHYGTCSASQEVSFEEPYVVKMMSDPMSCLIARSEVELRDLPDFGDRVRVEALGDDEYRFVQVLSRARFRRHTYVLTKPVDAELAKLRAVLERVTAIGGSWERVMGGVLILFVPQGSLYNPDQDVHHALARPERTDWVFVLVVIAFALAAIAYTIGYIKS